MFWTTGVVLAALTCSQVLAGVVKPDVFSEDANTEVLAGNERIVGGWQAYPGQFPYIAQLRFMNTGGSIEPCGGAVVHRNWILTSGRCANARISVVVRAGITDLTAVPEYISEDAKWLLAPSYDGTVFNRNNIAILQLQEPLTYSKMLQPIRVLPAAEALANYDNQVLIASGWGRTNNVGTAQFPNILRWVYLRGISNTECNRLWGNQIANTHICTTGFNASQTPTTGDIGGPLVHEGGDEGPVLVGLSMFWNDAFFPAGYVRPGAFHEWLTTVTNLDFENLIEEDEVTETPEPPITETTEPPTTEATEPSTTEATEPPTTEVTEPSTTEATEPPTTEATEPPTTEATEPPTTEATEPPTTEVTEPSTTKATEPPTTEPTDPDSEESDQNSNDSDSSDSKEDPDVSQLPNKLQVKVLKVSKSKINNNVNIN